MKSLIDVIEREELISKLKEKGYGDLISILLDNEQKVYTKKGRLNKSGACRILDWKPKQLEDALEECKKILQKEFDD
jgi:hypothetical protein